MYYRRLYLHVYLFKIFTLQIPSKTSFDKIQSIRLRHRNFHHLCTFLISFHSTTSQAYPIPVAYCWTMAPVEAVLPMLDFTWLSKHFPWLIRLMPIYFNVLGLLVPFVVVSTVNVFMIRSIFQYVNPSKFLRKEKLKVHLIGFFVSKKNFVKK